MDKHRRNGTWAAAAALAIGGGCWQEVHFTPPPETVASAEAPGAAEGQSPAEETSPVDAVVVETAEAPAPSDPVVLEEPAVEPPPRDEPVTLPDPLPTAPPAAIEAGAPAPATPSAEVPPIEVPPAEAAAPTSAPEQLQAWRAASQWALAAALYAKGQTADRYEPVLAEATAAAADIGLELPPLPTGESEAARQAAVVAALRDDAGPALAEMLGKQFGAAEQAAAELAIQSRLWLLTYSPQSDAVIAEAAAARQAAVASGLPAELWAPLVQLVEARGAFIDVRQAAFDLDRRVEAHLKSQP